MNDSDKILTLKGLAENTLKEKGSQFIVKCYPVSAEKDALNILNDIRKKYFDATHHCFAYRLINNVLKYSDDGEPNGTAGLRILNAIDHFSLTNLLVVVIRYFGGTKLGVGPLGKAYYNSTLAALERAVKIEESFYKKIIVTVDFSQISHVHHVINNFDVKLTNIDYKDLVTFDILVKLNELEQFNNRLIDELKGGVKIKVEDKIVLE